MNQRILTISGSDKYLLRIEEPKSDGYKVIREKEFGSVEELVVDVKKVLG